jgi:hypothetical protein
MKYTVVTSWSGHFVIMFFLHSEEISCGFFRQSHLLFRNYNDQNYENPQPQETPDVRDIYRFWVKMRPKLWIREGIIQYIGMLSIL